MTTFQGNGIFCLRIVVDIVVPSAPFELIAAIVQVFDRCVTWVHYGPPYKNIIHNNTQCVKKIHNDTQISYEKEDISIHLLPDDTVDSGLLFG